MKTRANREVKINCPVVFLLSVKKPGILVSKKVIANVPDTNVFKLAGISPRGIK
jgi:hypothetical protein